MRKTVVSLSRNQVVTLKRKVVVTLNGISTLCISSVSLDESSSICNSCLHCDRHRCRLCFQFPKGVTKFLFGNGRFRLWGTWLFHDKNSFQKYFYFQNLVNAMDVWVWIRSASGFFLFRWFNGYLERFCNLGNGCLCSAICCQKSIHSISTLERWDFEFEQRRDHCLFHHHSNYN